MSTDDFVCVLLLNTVRQRAPAAEYAPLTSSQGTRTRVFTFNDDEYCHWLYDWNSGTSQRERARLHYFRVYVFQRVSHPPSIHPIASQSTTTARMIDDESAAFQWEVASAVSSPGFTISAFRKEATTPSVGDAVLSVGVSSPSPVVLPNRGVSRRFELDRHPQQTAGSTRYFDHHQQQQQLPGFFKQHEPRPPNEHESSFLMQWTRANPKAVAKSTKLALAALVLSQLDINWLDPAYFASNLFGLLRQWPVDGAVLPPRHHREDALWHFVSHVAPKLLSLFGASISSVSSESASPPAAGVQQAAELAEIGFSLFCHLMDESQWGSVRDTLLQNVVDSIQLDEATQVDPERIANAVSSFHDALEFQASAWLVQRGLSLESLVDDLVSCVFVDRARLMLFPATLDRHVLALLRNDKFVGLDMVVGQFHELQQAVAQRLARDRRRQFRRPGSAEQDQPTGTRPCHVNGEWVCRAMDVNYVDQRAWSESRSRSQRVTNARVRLGVALSSLLLSAGFHMELKDVGMSSSPWERGRRRHNERGRSRDAYSEDEEEEKEEGGVAGGQIQPGRLQLELSALTSLFPHVHTRLELDGDLRVLPALANGLTPAWLGVLSFPLDDGIVDYSAYLTTSTPAPVSSSSGPRSRRQGTEEDEELFLSFFYYANDGSAYRLRMELSEDPSKPNTRRWARSSDHLNVFVQVAVGRSPGVDPESMDWGRLNPRERHSLVGSWGSLASFHLLYDRVAHTARADEDGYPMDGTNDTNNRFAQPTPPAFPPLGWRSSERSHSGGDEAAVV